jgi:hypothetical protein
MRKEQLLAVWVHGEEATDNRAGTALRAALARPGRTVEGVEPVVDRDLFAFVDSSPGEDPDAVSHGVRLAGVVQVAARWRENSEAVEPELAQVDALPVRGSIDFGGCEDPHVTASEDELGLLKRSAGVDAPALGACLAYLDITDHSFNL